VPTPAGAPAGVPAGDLLSQMDRMDEVLRIFFQRGAFIWEPELMSAFPPDPYWFLWGSPQIETGYG
jgi:hypothetical protein